jgi:hypothetical protein
MRRNSRFWVCAATLGFSALTTLADGYLWMSAEFSTPFGTPPKIWRYNVTTGVVDYSIEPMLGGLPLDPLADVYNNLAVDASRLYVGTDDSDVFAIADPLTGVCASNPGYNPDPGGSFEDGAWRESTNTLWRTDIAFNRLLESDSNGNVLSIRSISGDPFFATGLEWIGEDLYSTGLDYANFGRITLTGATTATFTKIPLFGLPAGHITGGLAYDRSTSKLYMITIAIAIDGNNHLWTVDPDTGVMTHVVKLSDVGYPAAGVGGAGGYILGDAMGWSSFIPEPASLSLLAVGGLFVMRRRR